MGKKAHDKSPTFVSTIILLQGQHWGVERRATSKQKKLCSLRCFVTFYMCGNPCLLCGAELLMIVYKRFNVLHSSEAVWSCCNAALNPHPSQLPPCRMLPRMHAFTQPHKAMGSWLDPGNKSSTKHRITYHILHTYTFTRAHLGAIQGCLWIVAHSTLRKKKKKSQYDPALTLPRATSSS